MKKMRRGMYIHKHKLIYKLDEYYSLCGKKDAKSVSRKIKLQNEFRDFYENYMQPPCENGCKTGRTKTCRSWCYIHKIWYLGKQQYKRGDKK